MLQKNGGKAPTTYTQFLNIVKKVGEPARAMEPAPSYLDLPGKESFKKAEKSGVKFFDGVPTLSDLSDRGYSDSDKTTTFKVWGSSRTQGMPLDIFGFSGVFGALRKFDC